MTWQPFTIVRVLLLVAVAASLAAAQQVGVEQVGIEQDRQRQLWEGLLQRRMFTLAESLCREQLTDPSASPYLRAEWAGRLIRSLVENARQLPAAQRNALWQKADQTAKQLVATDPQNPWNCVVQYQSALALVARAEASVLPSELGLMDVDVALADLRSAAKELGALETEVEQQLRTKSRGNTVKEITGPTQLQLKTLRARVFDALGQVFLYQARLYKLGTPDQLNSCLSAIRYFEKISPTDVPADVWDQVKIHTIVALRLKRDFAAAERELDRLLEADTPAEMKLMARAERIRLALAQQQGERAQAYVTRDREVDGRVHADLDLARLETMLYQWKQSSESGNMESARSWREKAVQLVAVIEREHSPYWLQRAETLLATAAASGSHDDYEVLQRTAKNLYLRGQLDESVVAYDQASAVAEANGNPDAAFQLAFQAAAVQDKRGLNEDALRRFRSAASRFPAYSEAPRAHELAIVKAAAMALQSTDSSRGELDQRLRTYQQLLSEHLTQWPNSPSSGRVRLWLAKLYEHQKEYWLAAEMYSSIRNNPADPSVIFDRAKSCYVQALEQATERERKLHDAVTWLREIAADRPVDSQRRSAAIRRREAILLTAELQLRFAGEMTTAELGQLIRSLKTLLNQTPETDTGPWRNRAHVLIIAALARSAKWDLAARQVADLQPAASQTWFELLALLSRREIAMDGSQQDLGRLQWQALERQRDHKEALKTPEQQQLVRWRAEAMMRLGDFASAREVLGRLAQQQPDDLKLRETYARCLMQANEPAVLKQALEQWRVILQHHPPQSTRWFRAKYAIALAHHKLGQSKRAAEMIQLLAALYPELGGPEMRLEFQTLLAECEGQLK